MVYETLNKFKRQGGSLLLGYCWIPNKDVNGVLMDLQNLKNSDPNNIQMPDLVKIDKDDYHDIQPPTQFQTNEFTWVFQEITNTYGIPTFQEVNPTLFNCVTFPFLFGIMFGDACHGLLYLLLGAGLCHWSDDIFAKLGPRHPMRGAMQIRYLLLLMGFFATFCGLMYNDFASLPLFYGSSCYDIQYHEDGALVQPQEPERIPGCTRWSGLDPVWYLTKDEISFMNSLKMKLAVIVGVAHMALGVLMKGFNSAYFGRYVDFIFEFIPQILMLLALFGYMDYLIMAKWTTDWSGREGASPAIISTMIGMFLGGGEIPPGSDPLIGTAEEQKTIQLKLLVITLICAPMMLLPKPILTFLFTKTDHEIHNERL